MMLAELDDAPDTHTYIYIYIYICGCVSSFFGDGNNEIFSSFLMFCFSKERHLAENLVYFCFSGVYVEESRLVSTKLSIDMYPTTNLKPDIMFSCKRLV